MSEIYVTIASSNGVRIHLLHFLTPGSACGSPQHQRYVVVEAQGGITFDPEQGELWADFCYLGITSGLPVSTV